MGIAVRQSLEGVSPPGVSQTGFMAGIWIGVAVSGLVLICRLIARFRGPHRLFWDDAFAVIAFVLVLATGAVWQWGAPSMYYTLNVQAGLAIFEQIRFYRSLRYWMDASLIAELFFYTSLMLIKLSFMFFFRRLGQGISFFKWLWWPVLFVTMGSYFAAMGNVDYKCLAGSLEYILGQCNEASEIKFTRDTLKANCALDVLTDFLIMLLPTTLLWRTRIQRVKKIAILGLFSLTLVTITIAIVRVATIDLTRRPDGNIDTTYLWLWSAIEPPVAIVVSCLSAFPQLFTSSTVHKKPTFTPSESRIRMMYRIRSKQSQPKDSWAELDSVSRSAGFGLSRVGRDWEGFPKRSEDSLQPVLAPNTSGAVVSAHAGPRQSGPHGPADRITHQFELTVTTQTSKH